MPIQRIFLDWDAPLLPRVVEQLVRHYPAQNGSWDLSKVRLLLPGARAARRLLELLVQRADHESRQPWILLPPTLLTQGELPEQLYTPPLPVVDDALSLLLRARVLRARGREALEQLAMALPSEAPLTDWLSLARVLTALRGELSTVGLRVSDVLSRLDRLQLGSERARWQALEVLEQHFEEALHQSGLLDLVQARRQALESSSFECVDDIWLISNVELPPLFRTFLVRTHSPIFCCIFAPSQEADAFDPLGALRPEVWSRRILPLGPTQLRVVDRPVDQVSAVLEKLAALQGAFRADQITLGLGDENLKGLLERGLSLAGVPTRAAVGEPWSTSAPAMLLKALADLWEDERPDRLAALARHPDVERWLKHQPEPLRTAAPGQLLTLLDQFTGERLPVFLPDQHLEQLQREPVPMEQVVDQSLQSGIPLLVAFCKAVRNLLPTPPKTLASLKTHRETLRALLLELYGTLKLRRYDPAEHAQVEAFELLLDVLESWKQLEGRLDAPLEVDLSMAIRLLLQQLDAAKLPAPADPDAVELLGWLEVPLDDAPVVMLLGFNEGLIPASARADIFLPERMRNALGLVDNAFRLARDLLLLTQLLHSRTHTLLIAGRRSETNDPLAPSRLLFTGPAQDAARVVLQFYGDSHASPLARPWLEAGGQSKLLVPAPQPHAPLTSLKVTAFRSYLSCPYRFYLQHILRLRTLDDRAPELDPASFGTLAHDALCALGQEPSLRAATEPDRIGAFLVAQLEQLAMARFGKQRRPAVALQLRALQQRLLRFAEWQAQQPQEGWHILAVEQALEHTLVVDGLPFVIEGRVDRVDRHHSGQHRILDYKTPDTPREPDKTHRVKTEEGHRWVDLQLPLYRLLGQALGIAPSTCDVGYVALSAELSASPLLMSGWDSETFASAEQTAAQVIRDIRKGIFWPYNPDLLDEFSAITFDRSVEPGSFCLPDLGAKIP